MNDKERAPWIDNDEGLYFWKRRTGLSMRDFIRHNREEIDSAIAYALDPKCPKDSLGRCVSRDHSHAKGSE